jgi:two-component system chemotaxis response regulator CheB
VTPIRVLVADDSAFTRKALKEILDAAPGITVVGIARDGLEALEKVAELHPDVVTLDLVMPNLDGVGFLRALKGPLRPRVVVVSMSDVASDLGAEALQLGAVDLVHKPTALATDQLYEIAKELVAKVRAAAQARSSPGERSDADVVPARPLTRANATRDVVVIGTSTGGPQAITRVLRALPGDLPVPVAIALHIPYGYTEALARRLDDVCALSVHEASDGVALAPGTAVLARGGWHLELARTATDVVARLDNRRGPSAYTPSVDLLFESAVAAYGSRVLAVVLTGMGDDGLRGARAVRAAGGAVLAEAESSCVVYGMPRSVNDAGLVQSQVPLDDMAAEIVRFLSR